MGNFYTNITVRGVKADRTVGVLRDLGREAYLVELNGDTIVFDRQSESQDTEILAALGEHLATKLEASAFAVLNHDDDLLWFQVYDHSELVAEYANRGGPRTNVHALCRVFNRPKDTKNIIAVWLLLRRPFLFQVNRHRRLARRLGLPEASVGSGFDYLSRGEVPPGVTLDQVIHVRGA
jgi:hypothetical protein